MWMMLDLTPLSLSRGLNRSKQLSSDSDEDPQDSPRTPRTPVGKLRKQTASSRLSKQVTTQLTFILCVMLLYDFSTDPVCETFFVQWSRKQRWHLYPRFFIGHLPSTVLSSLSTSEKFNSTQGFSWRQKWLSFKMVSEDCTGTFG